MLTLTGTRSATFADHAIHPALDTECGGAHQVLRTPEEIDDRGLVSLERVHDLLSRVDQVLIQLGIERRTGVIAQRLGVVRRRQRQVVEAERAPHAGNLEADFSEQQLRTHAQQLRLQHRRRHVAEIEVVQPAIAHHCGRRNHRLERVVQTRILHQSIHRLVGAGQQAGGDVDDEAIDALAAGAPADPCVAFHQAHGNAGFLQTEMPRMHLPVLLRRRWLFEPPRHFSPESEMSLVITNVQNDILDRTSRSITLASNCAAGSARGLRPTYEPRTS